MKQLIAKVKIIEDLIFFGKVVLKKDQVVDCELRKLKMRKDKKVLFNQFFYKNMPLNIEEIEVINVEVLK